MLTGREMPLPGIHPGPDGDIDIHWIHPEFRLLLCIGDDTEPAAFHVSRRGGDSARAAFDPDTTSLMPWLKG